MGNGQQLIRYWRSNSRWTELFASANERKLIYRVSLLLKVGLLASSPLRIERMLRTLSPKGVWRKRAMCWFGKMKWLKNSKNSLPLQLRRLAVRRRPLHLLSR